MATVMLDERRVTSPTRVPEAVMDCNPASSMEAFWPDVEIGKVMSLGTKREASYPPRVRLPRTPCSPGIDC